MATPTLTDRDQKINAETDNIADAMYDADVDADRKERIYIGISPFLPHRVMRAHAREVATRAYDAAQERATLGTLNNL